MKTRNNSFLSTRKIRLYLMGTANIVVVLCIAIAIVLLVIYLYRRDKKKTAESKSYGDVLVSQKQTLKK